VAVSLNGTIVNSWDLDASAEQLAKWMELGTKYFTAATKHALHFAEYEGEILNVFEDQIPDDEVDTFVGKRPSYPQIVI
jgi:hypothetical protein